MGATLEWDCIPFVLSTPQGTLELNTPDAIGTGVGYYLLDRGGCSMVAPLRVSIDEVAADDGAIPHRVFTSGYRVDLAVELWENATTPASGSTLVEMNDLLMRHLNRCRADGSGRLLWTPSGAVQRMVDDLWWDVEADATADTQNDLPLWTVKFGMVSPFPYAMVAAETTTHIANHGTGTLDNDGSAQFFPVIKINGPATDVLISNDANDGVIHYDSTLPGGSSIAGGHYVEVDCFRNTAFLDGDAAERLSSIDPFQTVFFKLEIGENNITVDGASVDILWQPAFA